MWGYSWDWEVGVCRYMGVKVGCLCVKCCITGICGIWGCICVGCGNMGLWLDGVSEGYVRDIMRDTCVSDMRLGCV